MTLLQRLLVSLPALVILLLPMLRNPDANAWFTLGLAVFYAIVALPLIVLQYLRFRYWITPREIVIQRGVVNRQQRSIPIERIQNIEIEQSLLPRLFGTAKVRVETAGSTSTEGVLEYVALEEARRVRAVVRQHQRRTAAGVPTAEASEETPEGVRAEEALATAPEQEAAETVLFTMPLSRVLLSGAFRFSLLYIAVAFSGIEYAGLNVEDVVDWLTRDGSRLVSGLESSPWLLGLLSVLLAALLAWVSGILINLNRYYGFRLAREGDKLHRRHGLLTVSEGTIPLRRVQALLMRTNPLKRRFGWYALELQTMGIDVRERGRQVAVPFAQEDRLLDLVQHFFPFTLPETFRPVSRLTIRRTAFRYVGALALAALGAGFFWRPALWALLAAPALVYLAVLQYRRHGYALDGDLLFVRRGVFRQTTWVLPARKFQVFHLSGSLFQRRLGLRTLYVDTAGPASLRPPVVVDLPEPEAEALLDTLQERFRTTMGGSSKGEGRSSKGRLPHQSRP